MSKADQRELVDRLCVEAESMDSDEWYELYEKLDPEHRRQVDAEMDDFADNAVGSPTWRSDEGHGEDG